MSFHTGPQLGYIQNRLPRQLDCHIRYCHVSLSDVADAAMSDAMSNDLS
jgi:hypothetical protein